MMVVAVDELPFDIGLRDRRLRFRPDSGDGDRLLHGRLEPDDGPRVRAKETRLGAEARIGEPHLVFAGR